MKGHVKTVGKAIDDPTCLKKGNKGEEFKDWKRD